MSDWLARLERALQDGLEGFEARTVAEHCFHLERLLPRAAVGRFCPNRVLAPVPIPALFFQQLVEPPGSPLAEWHSQPGPTGWCFAYPSRSRASFILEVVEGLGEGKAALVDAEGCLVGRSARAQLRLGFPGVSRRHLLLIDRVDCVELRGECRVNGQPVTETVVRPCDTIEIPGSRLLLQAIGDPLG